MRKFKDYLNEQSNFDQYNQMIDYTYLNDRANIDDIKRVCETARQNHFYSVCIKPDFITYAKSFLEGTTVKVCSVIDFPKGTSKTIEKDKAISDGVDEVDVVFNFKKLIDITAKSNTKEDIKELTDDVRQVALTCHKNGVIVKIIIETCALTFEQIKVATEICVEAGVDFIKTSTGDYKPSNTLDEKLQKVKFIRKIAPESVEIKVSGGIRTTEDMAKFASYVGRIGTSSIPGSSNNTTGTY
jgi:deoxyribose-phosphate aldolase